MPRLSVPPTAPRAFRAPRAARPHAVRALAIRALAASALAACAPDARPPVAPAPAAPDPLPPLAGAAVRPVLALVDSTRAGEAVVRLTLDAHDLRVGAYQGELTYDADRLELLAADGPTGPADGVRVVNARTPGVVRWVGFTTTAFRTDSVAVLRFRVRDWRGVATLRAALDVAADAGGARLPASALVPAPRLRRALGAGGA